MNSSLSSRSLSSAMYNPRVALQPYRWLGPFAYLVDFGIQTFSYRGYIVQSVSRDLSKKYKRSSLGYLWSMLNPLLMIAVLTIVFSNLLPKVEYYSVYLFSALAAWQFFSSTVSECMNSVRSNMNLISQVPMPKFIFPVTVVCSNLVNFSLTLCALFLVMFVVGHPPPWTIILFPLVFLPLLLIALGLGLLLAVSEIFFEDTKHLTKVVLQAWYYLTPVLYGADMMPAHVVKWLQLNPLFFPIAQLREVFYHGTVPDIQPLAISFLVGIVLLTVALCVFYRSEDKFIYFV